MQWGHIFPDQGSHWLMLTSVTVCGQARRRETHFLTQKKVSVWQPQPCIESIRTSNVSIEKKFSRPISFSFRFTNLREHSPSKWMLHFV